MYCDLKNKTAIITGAGAGIGRAVAIRFAQEGMNIVLCGRTQSKLEETQKQLQQYGVKSLIITGNLREMDYLQEIIDKSVEAFGGIDVLINNAGETFVRRVEDSTLEDFKRIMQTNFRAPYFLCQYAIPHLKKSDCPCIINVASVAGHRGDPLESIYSSSKHALYGFTSCLAQDLDEYGIRAYIFAPGGMDTDMIRQRRPEKSDFSDYMKPEEIAELLTFWVRFRNNTVVDEIKARRVGKAPFSEL